MEFIGYTALIDAVVVVLSWVVLFTRKSKISSPSKKMNYLSSYLVWTLIFLLLIAYTIFILPPSQMMIGLIVADLVLWISMVIFILMMYADTQGRQKGLWVGLFLIFAAMRTSWQVAQVQGIDTSLLGVNMNYLLSTLDQWLMYAVWLPSAFVLLVVGLNSDSALVRLRSMFFAIGLLLISFTWAFRFLGAGAVSQQAGYALVAVGSVLGFVLLLMGLLYKGNNTTDTQNPTPTVTN
ncbi:MAG: hypothetical protein WC011_02345 [Candidatus Paceibacterota bacterium]